MPASNPNGGASALIDPAVVPAPSIEGTWTVDKVLVTIDEGAPQEGSESPIPFFHMLEKLKTTKREGWRRFDINRGESISDHMYRMSLISMLAPPSLSSKLDIARCMKMSLIHDMAESLVGDITPVDDVSKPEKNRRESETIEYISKRLLGSVYGGVPGEQIQAIWQEYEDSKTDEAIFVHDVDKIELLLQMVEYEKRGGGLDLGEFAYVATKVVLPECKDWARQILKEREELWGEKEHIHGEKGSDGGMEQDVRSGADEYYERD
ncbi:hypothetical protein MKZ38_005916 [Zalerion maritima]|uniref:5'-deoxynucleotidase n=1 Tax=Zalerion maritima TaxID=339359 RepID=A0AAD5WQ21_9PEZI|nr:hypothetical protein MKZ38_005916 [Zalerion maritima]